MHTRLLLCGTVHDDLLGPRRLEKVLADFKPDFITLENDSEQNMTFIGQHECLLGQTLKAFRTGQEQVIPAEFHHRINWPLYQALAVVCGYESWVTANYAVNNGIQFSSIELESETALRKTLAKGDPDYTSAFRTHREHEEETAKDYAVDYCRAAGPKLADAVRASNRKMTGRLQLVMNKLSGARIAHIGGAAHLNSIEPSLPTLLVHHTPMLSRLDGADALPEPMGGYRCQGTLPAALRR